MQWNPALYDTAHGFVSLYGQDILKHLDPKPGEWILDLGCGTGDLTRQIFDTGALVTGADYSEEMIKTARSKYPEIQFLQMDARYMQFDKQFDAIFSNAALHWIPEKEKVIAGMYASLKATGKIVLEFGGKGNVGGIVGAITRILAGRGYYENAKTDFWYFPSDGEYATELERQNFKVIFAAHFDRTTPLNGTNGMKEWFSMFGNNFFTGISETEKEQILNEVEDELRDTHFKQGGWIADYKRIRIVAIKDN